MLEPARRSFTKVYPETWLFDFVLRVIASISFSASFVFAALAVEYAQAWLLFVFFVPFFSLGFAVFEYVCKVNLIEWWRADANIAWGVAWVSGVVGVSGLYMTMWYESSTLRYASGLDGELLASILMDASAILTRTHLLSLPTFLFKGTAGW